MVGLGQLACAARNTWRRSSLAAKACCWRRSKDEEEIRKADLVLQRDQQRESRRGSARGGAGADQAQGGALDPAAFKNHYTQALRELINLRIKGKAPKVETEEEARPSGDNVIDLMAALKKSLAGGGETCAAARKGGTAAKSSVCAKKRAPAKPVRKPAARKARKSA